MLTPAELKDRLSGVLVFATTPFEAGSLELDLGGFRLNMEFLAGGGIQAVAVAGFVGEYSALTTAEYEAVVRTAARCSARTGSSLPGSATARSWRPSTWSWPRPAAPIAPRPARRTSSSRPRTGWWPHVTRVASAIRIGVMIHSMPGLGVLAGTGRATADVPGVVAYKDELGDVRGFGENR